MLSICKCKSIHFESRDADGAISTSELGKLMRSLGKMPTEAEVAEMMKQVHIYHIYFIGTPPKSSKYKIKLEYQDWYPPKTPKCQPVSKFSKKKV